MTQLRAAANGDPAQWLLDAPVDWWNLVRYGPPGFDAYVRVTFDQGSPDVGDGEDPTLRSALATLATYTRTPTVGYAAIWEGWGGTPNPAAPRIDIPERAMLLFTGPIEEMRDAPSLAWFGAVVGFQEPNLVWPEDQAWCLACEVDEEIEFSVGCSTEAAQALSRALPGAVRQVGYGDPAPLLRDPD